MTSLRHLPVQARQRSYIVHRPQGHGREALPVVLAFHGGGTDAEFMMEFCGLRGKADEAGFIAAFPNGSGRLEHALTWNAGSCCGRAARDQVDDVAFTRAILEDLSEQFAVDRSRVYATGMSNGAMLRYRLANEMSDQIAAIAPVAGPMCQERCTPTRPMPICHFHGTADQFAPYMGGIGVRSLTKTKFMSVRQTIEMWVEANGCSAEPMIERLATIVEDGTQVTRTLYRGCRERAEVLLYTIEGGGHTWPGRQTAMKHLGPATQNISANDLIWEFFKDKSLAGKV